MYPTYSIKNNYNNLIEIVSLLSVDFIRLCGSCPEIFGLRSLNPEPLGWWVKPATATKVSLSDDLGHPNHQYLMCCTISQIMIRAYSGNIWLKYTLATCLRSNITILFHFWGQLDRTVVCKSGQKAIVVQLVFSRLPEIILVLSGSSSFLRDQWLVRFRWTGGSYNDNLSMSFQHLQSSLAIVPF